MFRLICIFFIAVITFSCVSKNKKNKDSKKSEKEKIQLIIDSDANNELDDQHAIAYALFNGDVFNVIGVTVNDTRNGNGIDNQLAEAKRVVKLCNLYNKVPVLKGAEKSFFEIKDSLNQARFDGYEAVNFIIEQARVPRSQKLILVPIGKLTNIALALTKDPSIVPNIKVIWLGSNFPYSGYEYNMDNDTSAINPVIESGVEFEIVVVRNGSPTGTQAVIVKTNRIKNEMPGLGPRISEHVIGRHGGEFNTFGDYSYSLFKHADSFRKGGRSMYDVCAFAVLKDSLFARYTKSTNSYYKNGDWIENPSFRNEIGVWDNFKADSILNDMFRSLKNYKYAVKGD